MSDADRAAELDELGALRNHLLRHPDDQAVRLRLADRLRALGEAEAVRAVLAPLDVAQHPLRREAVARLAALDETEGHNDDAAAHWERVLCDDIDDDLAWAQLRRLRPLSPAAEPGAAPPGALVAAPTLETADHVPVGRFQLLREIGRGSSATVYLARDQALGLELALKVLHPRAAGAAEVERRFFTEARAMAGLRHPGIVAIYHLDEASRTLVMEHVPGGTLRERLRALAAGPGAGRGLPPDEALSLARRLLDALAYAHGRGVVHGDLSPRNVLLRRPGAPVLVDFGAARLRDAGHDDADLAAGGTPLYLAPELFRGEPVSEATDLFAAGALLWEALAGTPMRRREDLLAGRAASRPLPAPAIAALTPSATALARLVERLTAPDPARRPPGAADALRAL